MKNNLAIIKTFMLVAVGGLLPAKGGTVITDNLPASTAIINIDAARDGAASCNGDQTLWYHPFSTIGAASLLEYAVTPGTYCFRIVNPMDAAALFPALTSAQTNEIFTAWTFNSPWVTDYLVFDGDGATNYALPQLFDGACTNIGGNGPFFLTAAGAYSGAVTNGSYARIRAGANGRAGTEFVGSYSFSKPATLVFAVPDYALSDNAGGVSVLIYPVVKQTTNLLLNPGGEAGWLTNWTSGAVSNALIDDGTFDYGINPHNGKYDFVGHTGASASLSQVVSLVGNQGISSAAIDTGTLLAVISFWEQGLDQGTLSDDAYVGLAFLDGMSNELSNVATPEVDSHNLEWANYTTRYTIPAGTRYIQYTMNFVRHAGSDLDGFVDDNYLAIEPPDYRPVLSIRPSGTNMVTVFWPSYAVGWTVETNSDLTTTNWASSGDSIQDDGTDKFIQVEATSGSRFYRLRAN